MWCDSVVMWCSVVLWCAVVLCAVTDGVFAAGLTCRCSSTTPPHILLQDKLCVCVCAHVRMCVCMRVVCMCAYVSRSFVWCKQHFTEQHKSRGGVTARGVWVVVWRALVRARVCSCCVSDRSTCNVLCRSVRQLALKSSLGVMCACVHVCACVCMCVHVCVCA